MPANTFGGEKKKQKTFAASTPKKNSILFHYSTYSSLLKKS